MHRECNSTLYFWEANVFGRLTPPPEDDLEMDRCFFAFKQNAFEEQSPEAPAAMEGIESSLLDLEFESICPGELNGYKNGPTLAELNETRSRSPLINPEMKRLHQAAIQTGGETSYGGKTTEQTTAVVGQPKTHSVLEQQLKTQPSSSICYEQLPPSRRDYSEQLSATVSRSEPICVPGREMGAAQSQQKMIMGVASPPPSLENKELLDDYKAQSVSPQLISPHFGNNYSAPSRVYSTNSQSTNATTAQSFRHQQQESVPNEQSSENHRSSKEEEATDQYEPSDDEEFESEEEMEDAEDYCPNEKEGKPPTRRKGRKSESEDMVPNPTKLLNIGRELDRLNKIIGDLKPINEMPQHSRGRSRKEKNKLASRACRLKKKQQHEANKLKLHGLASEQENLTFLISNMKNEIVSRAKLQQQRENDKNLNKKFQDMAKKALSQPVAGHTTEFVRKVLQDAAKGNQTAGVLHLLKEV